MLNLLLISRHIICNIILSTTINHYGSIFHTIGRITTLTIICQYNTSIVN